jgi:hypothetical protein
MQVSYDGDEELTFFMGDYTEGVGTDELDITIQPGEVVPVGIIIDSSGLVDGDAIDGQLSFYAELGSCGE